MSTAPLAMLPWTFQHCCSDVAPSYRRSVRVPALVPSQRGLPSATSTLYRCLFGPTFPPEGVECCMPSRSSGIHSRVFSVT
ncbi:hypothetical protein PR003_g22184 [Phytophthora rubi]|uniref:Uncharacterized protein n=1 Tax=Phytophthora rubi TaxID=129364 RepID=A0A6A4D683_9STRA|nr:hypothetical protein PR002_g12493 [Phytophthora rubi]KAE9034171.1 hypothetical protein PR001_g9846 [Phytophthora rubi]KAE9302731.1 hypothetical protein PR003_g22184 [Phytophthora rubi]